MTPLARTIVGRLDERYRAHANPERAAPMRAYMRDRFPFLGIVKPAREALDREIVRDLPEPTEADLEAIARACWAMPERELHYFAMRYLAKHAPKVASAAFLDVVRTLVTTHAWWDTVDDLAQNVVGPLVARHPELRATMDAWAEDEDPWIARTAILHQNKYRANTDPRRLFAYCRARASEKDFFMRKAIGWALRTYAAVDPDAVARFVEENEARLSPLSKREALRGVARAGKPRA